MLADIIMGISIIVIQPYRQHSASSSLPAVSAILAGSTREYIDESVSQIKLYYALNDEIIMSDSLNGMIIRFKNRNFCCLGLI